MLGEKDFINKIKDNLERIGLSGRVQKKDIKYLINILSLQGFNSEVGTAVNLFHMLCNIPDPIKNEQDVFYVPKGHDIKSEEVAKNFLPKIKLIRKALFEGEKPPFKSRLEVNLWFFKEFYQSLSNERLKEELITWQDFYLEGREEYGLEKGVFIEGQTVTLMDDIFWGCFSSSAEEIAKKEGFLYKYDWPKRIKKLHRTIKRVSEYVGWTERDSEDYILLGIQPQIEKYFIKRRDSYSYMLRGSGYDYSFNNKYVVLEINTPHITKKEWNEALKLVKKSFESDAPFIREKGISDEKSRLVKYVKENGDVLSKKVKTKTEFWKKIQKLFQSDNPDTNMDSWHAVKKGYERACKRLEIDSSIPGYETICRKGVKSKKSKT